MIGLLKIGFEGSQRIVSLEPHLRTIARRLRRVEVAEERVGDYELAAFGHQRAVVSQFREYVVAAVVGIEHDHH
jgi:hypothetical protein